MNFNYQKARELMVENQLRPNKIKDPVILNLFKKKTKRDIFTKKYRVFILFRYGYYFKS